MHSFVTNGAIIAKIPMVIVMDSDLCEAIHSGDYVSVDAERGSVEARRQGAAVSTPRG
jgi:predicted aconitase with swiveling domain